jgi:ferrous iron transport protein B
VSRSCDEPGGVLKRPEGDIVIAIAGNPNVGKSTIFNAITGLGVMTAHYPGTTRAVHTGTARAAERIVGVIDLPGTYGLSGNDEDARVARLVLLDLVPDVVVVVVDPVNLARTLYLALEVLDLGFRVVVAANLADEARRAGIALDAEGLSARLGVPVVPTVGTAGTGVRAVVDAAFEAAGTTPTRSPGYGPDFEALAEPLVRACRDAGCTPGGLPPHAVALALIEGDDVMAAQVDAQVVSVASRVRSAIRSHFGEDASVRLARERHGLAGTIGDAVVTRTGEKRRLPRDWWALTTWPWTGVPLAALVAGAVFAFLFFAGAFLAGVFSAVWQALASPGITSVVEAVAGDGVLSRVLLWGLDAGIEASLSVGLPYILVFYVVLGLLEDTGYLNSLAFLTDRFMHRLGLHGRAIIPLVAGAGCSVPALVATGFLPTKRERLIASTLVMFIPCSARTAVILGAVGHYVGWQYTLLVVGIVFVMWLSIALVLQRILPGESHGLVMEMFPFRRPSFRRVMAKAWDQFREFLFVATPIVVAGSLVLGGLYENGWLMNVSRPLEPVIGGWLGLPAVAGVTLLMGMLRNELALQLLVVLAVSTAGYAGANITDIMSPTDLVVFALVNTIALPCISAVAVFWRRNGLKRTLAVVGASIVLALTIGGIVARVLPLLGLE